VEIVILPTPADVGRYAARLVEARARALPTLVWGLATGSSPTAIYDELAGAVARGLDLSGVRGFALDEYVGISETHPESYARVIRTQVVEPLGLRPENVRVPDGRAADLEPAARDYERAIARAGGIDLQILGIGSNGHIGFNEPTSSFASRTRLKTLAPQTRADNARFFDDPAEVPTHCLTQGLGTILESREAVLVAQGEAKARAVAAMVEGPVSAMCPGSVLQFHPRAVVVLDEAAASALTLTDYYRHTFANKPAWQRVPDAP
jgi:glucosamine-6-phosphate deaminase